MAQTEAQLRATKKYHEKLDDIRVRVPLGDKKVFQDHAASQGESLNGFVRRAMIETMARDKDKK